jgi:hypothetical protein
MLSMLPRSRKGFISILVATGTVTTTACDKRQDIGTFSRLPYDQAQTVARVVTMDGVRTSHQGDLSAGPPVSDSLRNTFFVRVGRGETLYQLAGIYNVPFDLIMEENGLSTVEVHADQIIRIPIID